jgi:RNA polymerase sigma factor (sigma-70 family)
MIRSPDDVLERARRGERGAIDALLVRHQPDLRRFARRMCRTSEDAEDAAQHALVKLSTEISAFRGAAKITSWLFTVVKRECLRLVARVRRDVGADRLDERLAQVREPEVRLALERALSSLEPPLREVLLLRDVEELTGPEVAVRLGISLEAMKSRLHRARSEMRSTLEGA